MKSTPQFTHFASILFIKQKQRKQLSFLQWQITKIFTKQRLQKILKPNSPFLFHITLTMLQLPNQSIQQKIVNIINKHLQKQIQSNLFNSILKLENIKYFSRLDKNINKKQINVIYINIQNSPAKQNIHQTVDLLIRSLIKQNIITLDSLKFMHISIDHKDGLFKPQTLHVTLFRTEGLHQSSKFDKLFAEIKEFKFLFDCPSFDISTRGSYDSSKFYKPLYRVHLDKNH